jgi:hypothetical protein
VPAAAGPVAGPGRGQQLGYSQAASVPGEIVGERADIASVDDAPTAGTGRLERCAPRSAPPSGAHDLRYAPIADIKSGNAFSSSRAQYGQLCVPGP